MISRRCTVQSVLAATADLICNKRVMKVDEGDMIVFNEINKTLEVLRETNRTNKTCEEI